MAEILERGNVYFLYRPRVQEQEVEKFEDLQRSYLVLSPHGKQRFRLILLGQKQLPEIHDGGERVWGFVDKVSTSAQEMRDELEKETYETKTRGERVRPAARPAGEGVYAIVRHEDHTHLAYALELPSSPGTVQENLNIHDEASYILSIKNPDQPSPPGAGLSGKRKADFPKKLQDRFRGRRFADADPPEFLDYEGAEVLLVGAAEDVSDELGIKLNPQKETLDTAEIINELRLAKSRHPVEPLLKGEWR